MSGRFKFRAGTGASPCRASGQPPLLRFAAARMLAAIRQFILSLAVLGLLLSPTSGFAKGPMPQGQTIGTARHAPCCPEHPARDCAACAMMASCAFHCLDNVVAGTAITLMVAESPVAAFPGATPNLTGIEHPPPLRPPLQDPLPAGLWPATRMR